MHGLDGKWDDDGPGWDEYPEVKEACKPELGVENGIFWMEKDEFFNYFKTVYLCACDMEELSAAAVTALKTDAGGPLRRNR